MKAMLKQTYGRLRKVREYWIQGQKRLGGVEWSAAVWAPPACMLCSPSSVESVFVVRRLDDGASTRRL